MRIHGSGATFDTEDFRERVAVFLDKRKPRFTGRQLAAGRLNQSPAMMPKKEEWPRSCEEKP